MSALANWVEIRDSLARVSDFDKSEGGILCLAWINRDHRFSAWNPPSACGKEPAVWIGNSAMCWRHAQMSIDEVLQNLDRIHDKNRPTPIDYQARARGGCVYYVERDGFIKIGTTSNLPNRLKALARAGDLRPKGMTIGPVELLATHRGGRPAERAMHELFSDERVAGEWFTRSERLMAHISNIQARRIGEAA